MAEQMTKQQVFDKVARHLILQNCTARADGDCAYRAPGGMKCAAGILLADEHYKPEMEGDSSESREVFNALMASGVPEDAKELVADLQAIHDEHKPTAWPARLRALAKSFRLKRAVVGEALKEREHATPD